MDGYLAWEIYQDSFIEERFNVFIEIYVLPLMRPYSEDTPCCVLVIDNHSIYYSEELEVICERKGIYLVYLPSYSLDLNPIEQSFTQLKAWMRKNYKTADLFGYDFEGFIRLALRKVFEGKDARGYYRACGYGVSESYECSDSETE